MEKVVGRSGGVRIGVAVDVRVGEGEGEGELVAVAVGVGKDCVASRSAWAYSAVIVTSGILDAGMPDIQPAKVTRQIRKKRKGQALMAARLFLKFRRILDFTKCCRQVKKGVNVC